MAQGAGGSGAYPMTEKIIVGIIAMSGLFVAVAICWPF
jgi:hypothetical protein